MTNKNDIAKVLTKIGFSEYEAEAYLGLLQLRDASVSELAEVCAVPRSRLYDVLRTLAAAGYVETYEQDNLRAHISNTKAVIEEIDQWSNEFDDATDELEELAKTPKIEHSNVSIFHTRDATIQKAKDFISNSDHVVQICLSPAELVEMEPELSEAYKQGVTIRIALTFDPTEDLPDDLSNKFSHLATEVRRCEANEPFTALIDGSIAVLAIDNDWDGKYGLIVEDSKLSSILHWFFQLQLWEPWDTLYSTSVSQPEIYVSVRQLIRDFEMLRTDDEIVTVRVNGIDPQSHEAVEIEGEIVDVIYTDVYSNQDVTFGQQFIQAALKIKTDDGEYTVGGYGAVVEDIRAIEIDIVNIR